MRHFIILSTCMLSSIAVAAPAPDTEVFFSSDSSSLDSHAKAKLTELAIQARETSGTKVVLDAHADPSGSEPYNVGLSIRRAKAVEDFLTEAGVAADRIVMAAYGESGPMRTTWAQDRRVSLTITAEPLYSIIDGSGKATAVVWNKPVTLAEIEGPADKIPQTARR